MRLWASPERRKDAGAALLLAALVAFWLWPVLTLERVWFRVDFAHYIYPTFHWLHLRLSQGLSTAWAQDAMLGDPLYDTMASALLYPPLRLCLRFFDAVPAVALIWYAHLLLAAYGAYALARALRSSAPAALLAAVLTAFCGGMIYSAGAHTLLSPQAWFPWMLLGLVWIQGGGGRWRGAALLGLSSGAALLCGHIGMGSSQLWALAVLFAVWCMLGPWQERLRACAGPLAVAALICALLFAGQAWALGRVAAQSGRGHAYSTEEASADPLSPVALLQAPLPHALGRMEDNSFLGRSWRFGTFEPQGIVLYIGLLGLLLTAYGAWQRQRDAAPWLAAWAFLLLYALGRLTPLFDLLYMRLPIFDHLRAPVRSATLAATLLAPSAAWGLDALRQRASPRLGRWALAASGLLLLGALLLWLAQPWLMRRGEAYMTARFAGDPLHHFGAAYYLEKLQRWLDGLRGHLLAQGLFGLASAVALLALVRRRARQGARSLLLCLILFAELAFNLRGFHLTLPAALYEHVPQSVQRIRQAEAGSTEPFRALVWGQAAHIQRSFPDQKPVANLQAELQLAELPAPASHRWYGLDVVNAYPSPEPWRLDPFIGWFRDYDVGQDLPGQTRRLLEQRRLYELCGAKYVVSGERLDAPDLEPLMESPVYLYRDTRALPLAYVASDFSGAWSGSAAVKALLDPQRRESRWVRPALVEDPGLRAGTGGGTVHWLRYDDAGWALDVESQADGVLVLSRLHYDGPWRARLDGEPVPLLAANGALSAVRLPAGQHHVQIDDVDPSLRWAYLLQGLGLVLALLLFAMARETRA
jgi:hypothetical protein